MKAAEISGFVVADYIIMEGFEEGAVGDDEDVELGLVRIMGG